MKQCDECDNGYIYEYVGATPEKCPTCNGTGEVELTEQELACEQGWSDQDELHRTNLRLNNRI